MAKEKILVVDDEKAINKLVCSYLTKEQFRPLPAYNGEEALDLLKKENPDLIILDIMLPDTEGTALSLDIREYSNAPIIFLSCKTQEIDKIIALSAGGDDYMTKPFMPGELIARIKAHLRRQNSLARKAAEAESSLYEYDGLKIDFDTHDLYLDDRQPDVQRVRDPQAADPASQKGLSCLSDLRNSLEDQLHGKRYQDRHGLHQHPAQEAGTQEPRYQLHRQRPRRRL